MRKLDTADKITASYYKREMNITAAVWMPGLLQRTGVLRVHTHDGTYTSDNAFGWVMSARHFQKCTGLGPVLNYLGITTELQPPSDTEMTFARPEAIAERTADLNERLPQEHKLPRVAVYRGATIPGKLFLESLTEDTVLLANGRFRIPWRKTSPNALVAAHDIAFHLPSRLAMDPASRAALADQVQNVLRNPGKPDIMGRTRIDELAGRIDKFIAPPNLGPAKFGCPHDPLLKEVVGTETVLYHMSNAEVGGLHMPRERAAELGQLSVEYVAYLGEHITNMK